MNILKSASEKNQTIRLHLWVNAVSFLCFEMNFNQEHKNLVLIKTFDIKINTCINLSRPVCNHNKR